MPSPAAAIGNTIARRRTMLAVCALTVLGVVAFLALRPGTGYLTGLLLLAATVLTILPATMLRRWPLPALALLLGTAFAATLVVRTWEISYLPMLAGDLTVGYIAAVHRHRVSITAAALAVAVQLSVAASYRPGWDYRVKAIYLVLAVMVAWMGGNTIRDRRVHAETLRARASAQAVTAERLRIARELHDLVAHSIGIIAIQAGVAARVIDTQPAEARTALAAIELTSRETLAGLRRAVGGLRRAESVNPDSGLAPTPQLADLDALATATAAAGVRVDLRWQGRRRTLPAEIELSAYRIVQEALTNVVRHAGVAECRVTVDYDEAHLSITVEDDGRGEPTAGAGFGLVGMRERVELLGATLSAGHHPDGGFRVSVHLPLPASAR